MNRWRVGIDSGGTFTDFVFAEEESGEVVVVKLSSSREDPGGPILEGLTRHGPGGPVSFLCHGTTVGTNALLEEKGARTGLLVTAGFRGVYEIMEQARPYGQAMFDLRLAKPAPLVHPADTGEATERIGPRAELLQPLDEVAARAELARLAGRGVESLAICLLFSFLDPRHERRVAQLAAEVMPDVPVSCSSEVMPEIREYFRTSTTVRRNLR